MAASVHSPSTTTAHTTGAGDMPFPPRSGAGGIPKILTSLIDKLDGYLADPAGCLPSLNNANGSVRQQRRDRRTACVQLLRAQIKYLDLVSMRVGIPRADGSFVSLTLSFLAKQAGIGLRRAERAMRDLQGAGLVRSWQRCELNDAGEYRGLAALRQLPPALFGAFGLGKWLKHERSKAVMRRYRASAAEAKAQRQGRKEAQGSLFLNGLKHQIQKASGFVPRPADAEVDDAIRRRVGVLKMQHPDWDRDRCYDAAFRERFGAHATPGCKAK